MQKQTFNINFSKGIEQKVDSKSIPLGKFSSLKNSVFDKLGQFKKRNGNQQLSSLSDTSYSYLTTYRDNLIALGTKEASYSNTNDKWQTLDQFQPVSLSTIPIIQNNLNQIQCDSATTPDGLSIVVYSENDGTTTTYKYTILDSFTGQAQIVGTQIPVSSGVVTGSPRVFLLGNYFIIVFNNLISGTNHLQYVSISLADLSLVTAEADIASSHTPTTNLNWDGIVVNLNLYVAYNTLAGGQSLKVTYLSVYQASQGQGPAASFTVSSENLRL